MKNKRQTEFSKYILNPIFVGVFFVFSVFLVLGVNFLIKIHSMLAAPSREVKAVVHSKLLEPNVFGNKYSVTLESDKLPYGQSILDVSPIEYAAVSEGDVTCVRFKSIPEYPQYKEEFLFPWDCVGAKK